MKKNMSLYPRLLLLSLLLIMPAISMADRYATLVSGGSISLAEGETALVISCHNFSNDGRNDSNSTQGVVVRYAVSGGGSSDVTVTPAGFTSRMYFGTSPVAAGASGTGPSLNAPIPLVGPATISIPNGGGILGLKVVSTELSSSSGGGSQQATEGVPSNSVVIPENSAGPVEIILESSTDLITWTAANPGTYGSSTEKRFFRVRAVENPAP